MKKILIIAGSDSGGGAGVQADIKTAAAHNVYASTAITSVTSQNTLGVQDVHDLPVEIIEKQITSIADDIGADVIKFGMLGNAEIVSVVSKVVEQKLSNIRMVVDPVMVAKGGSKLLADEAIDALKSKMLNNAYVITPNIPEAEVLSRLEIKSASDMHKAARKIITEIKPRFLLLKGGHLDSDKLVDLLFNNDGDLILELKSGRIKTNNTHGTGCTYAAAIASNLALGYNIEYSVSKAHEYVNKLIKNAPKDIGSSQSHSRGPLWHFS